MPAAKKTAAKAPAKKRTESVSGFTAEERAAMKARAAEMKAEEKASKNRAEGEKALLDAIAKMKEPDRGMAKKVHKVVSEAAPDLWAKTWYGMPAYARDGKIICFFQPADKFGARYSTFGFNDDAKLDKGAMWPTSYALMKLTPAEEKKLGALVKQAVR